MCLKSGTFESCGRCSTFFNKLWIRQHVKNLNYFLSTRYVCSKNFFGYFMREVETHCVKTAAIVSYIYIMKFLVIKCFFLFLKVKYFCEIQRFMNNQLIPAGKLKWVCIWTSMTTFFYGTSKIDTHFATYSIISPNYPVVDNIQGSFVLTC